MVLTWEEFLAKGDEVEDSAVEERLDGIKGEQLATFIYTSGTTGPPKGVMLSHTNLTFTVEGALEILSPKPSDCGLSYLPLSHIAEQVFTIHAPISAGYPVYFAESIPKVADNLKEVQPTIFFGVPRIWEKFHAGITGKMAEAKGVKKALVNWAMGVGYKVTLLRNQGKAPSGFLAMQYNLATKLIFSKLKPAVGLGRARMCVTGAAPISQDILEFFAKLDVTVLEVYGQSEDCGPTSFNRPDAVKYGSVGRAYPNVTVKIAEDDEILVQGDNVFMGYYKDQETTDKTLIDGWLHSGDLGRIDDDGFLYIIGRKKDIIITAGGKNITPKNIESSMKNHGLVGEAVVIGDRRKYLTALISVDPEAQDDWCKANGISTENLHQNQTAIDSIQKHIDEEVNPHLARVEQIKKFRILPRPLSIEDGELTPTLKVKRNRVNEHFIDIIEEMYAD
jgi:long-chain acyl-CoA synthetase